MRLEYPIDKCGFIGGNNLKSYYSTIVNYHYLFIEQKVIIFFY